MACFWFFGLVRLIFYTVVSIITAYTADVGGKSDQCFLPTTPAAGTFGIWGFLYSRTIFNLGKLACDEDFLAATTSSTEWVRTWTNDNVRSATEALEATYQHLAASAKTHCGMDGDAELCCFMNQYATWAKSAYTQNTHMRAIYGDYLCAPGEGEINATYAKQLREDYVTRMTRFVTVELSGHMHAMKTFAHAAAGICETCMNPGDPIDYPNDPTECTVICDAAFFPEGTFPNVTSYGFGDGPDACSTIDPGLSGILNNLQDIHLIHNHMGPPA